MYQDKFKVYSHPKLTTSVLMIQ